MCLEKRSSKPRDLNYLETNQSQVIYNSEQHLSIMIYYYTVILQIYMIWAKLINNLQLEM